MPTFSPASRARVTPQFPEIGDYPRRRARYRATAGAAALSAGWSVSRRSRLKSIIETAIGRDWHSHAGHTRLAGGTRHASLLDVRQAVRVPYCDIDHISRIKILS